MGEITGDNFNGTIAKKMPGSYLVIQAKDGEIVSEFLVDEWHRDSEILRDEFPKEKVRVIDDHGSERTYIE